MATIHISRKALKAVSRFSAVKDTRYYLCGVYVQSNVMQTRLAATDGHALCVHRMDAKDDNQYEAVFIMPSDAVKQILSWKGFKTDAPVVLTVPDDYASGGEIRADWLGNVAVFKALDGKFPDVSRVIPTTLSGEAGQYNHLYMYRCQQACDDLNESKRIVLVTVKGNGANDCALVRINSDCFAVVMPIRAADPDVADCAWGREPLPELTVEETAPEQETVTA